MRGTQSTVLSPDRSKHTDPKPRGKQKKEKDGSNTKSGGRLQQGAVVRTGPNESINRKKVNARG